LEKNFCEFFSRNCFSQIFFPKDYCFGGNFVYAKYIVFGKKISKFYFQKIFPQNLIYEFVFRNFFLKYIIRKKISNIFFGKKVHEIFFSKKQESKNIFFLEKDFANFFFH